MKVHVLCPATTVTGGPEALHQLVDAGQRLGYDMAMVYAPEGHPDPTPPVFRMYAPRTALRVADTPDSVVIAAETTAPALLGLQHATRVLSWLSVDHYRNFAEQARPVPGAASPFDFVLDPTQQVVHVAQSEYARRWLADQGLDALMLTDYIRDELVDRANAVRGSVKEDIVAFNPKKGLEFTRALMAAAPAHVRWVPIQNMTPVEVAGLLGRSKVYIDFGAHPGRDRIPREAALCGCVVITGTQGSAAFDEDLPLPPGFKFDERQAMAVPLVLRRIETALRDYDSLSPRFEPYRQWIAGQREVFFDEVHVLLATLEARLRQKRALRAAA
ncbi:hypothetical protein [Sphaerotilus mobilis]|uniref:Glycosyl transferase family 1 n=1 Tax=Sphaerotilus mobilis TaxID=47994 RepID=A0A4Q7LRT2_9BURK|nr:hypothetical protein [Sphaerotilus mobilis]RZS56887.1 hypothetical protein EV685_1442 [Sphaerotilus mobilis]